MAEHHHHHHHDHGERGHAHSHAITKNLTVAFLLNLSFTIIEIVGGFLTNSIAILSDAIHDLGDTVAIGFALYLEKKSESKRDNKFSYGYRRWSTLSALINVIILTTGSIFIIVETIPRLISPQVVHVPGMIGLAVLGLLVNGAAVLKLKGNDSSINNRTVMLHLMEDAMGWAAVLVGSIVMLFTEFYLIDPLLSLLIAAIILRNAVKNLRIILNIFLQAVPKKLDLRKIETAILTHKAVKAVHDIHVWSLDGEFHVASLHIVVDESHVLEDMQSVKRKIRHEFDHLGVSHVTIEIELPDEDCEMVECNT
ncbi:MAG: cation transporter [Flavobacteriales bacterium]|nr:cation transporter [Flavobacteriales bacterium]